jgi:ribosome biogenesis protein MAK21
MSMGISMSVVNLHGSLVSMITSTPQLPLLHHYHPSVALHARQLLAHARVTATADLGLNTLSHFLDRFVYRNAKKPRPKGTSAMQPAAHNDGTGMVHAGKAAGATDVVNAETFRKRGEDDVPADQVRLFHRRVDTSDRS